MTGLRGNWRVWTISLLIALACCTAARTANAADAGSCPPIWPAGIAPGDSPLAQPMRLVERSTDPALPDRYVDHVSVPCIEIHRPARPNGRALLVLPGGGYQRIVLDKEGTALLPAFVEEAGDTLVVLRYRLPGEGRADREAALADAQRALRLILDGVLGEDIDPARTGVIGFSAGGHLAARLATATTAAYPAVDAADDRAPRPAFAALIYPVIDMQGRATHAGSRQRLLGDTPGGARDAGSLDAATLAHWSMHTRVHRDMPPVFLLHASDDTVVPVQNTLLMHAALLEAGVPTELHVFERGGHGFGTRGTHGLPVAAWPRLLHTWMDWLDHEAKRRGKR